MSGDVVDVVCIVFPDGRIRWIEGWDQDKVRACVDAWQAGVGDPGLRRACEDGGVQGGFVRCRVFRRDFETVEGRWEIGDAP